MRATAPRRAVRAAAAAAGLLLAACTARPAPAGGTRVVLPAETSLPQSVPAAAGTERRDIDLTVTATPNVPLRVGSRVTITFAMRNAGPAVRDLSPDLFAIPPAGLVWRIERRPPGTTVSEDCIEDPPGHQAGPRCAPFEITIPGPPALAAGGTWTATLVLAVEELRCPGTGDFVGELHAGSSPGINNPTGYRILMGFDNEPAEYAAAASPRPIPPSRCRTPSLE